MRLLEKNFKSKSFSSRIATEPDKREQEISSFINIDDGYKKIVITMDDDPFTIIENGYKKINALEFLLDSDILKII